MNDKLFCKTYNKFFEKQQAPIDEPLMVSYHTFNGTDLKEFVDFCIVEEAKHMNDELLYMECVKAAAYAVGNYGREHSTEYISEVAQDFFDKHREKFPLPRPEVMKHNPGEPEMKLG